MTLPKLRDELEIEVIEQDSGKFAVLKDPTGFVEQPVAIPYDIFPLFRMLDGKMTTEKLQNMLSQAGARLDMDPFLQIIDHLDKLGFMDSELFRKTKRIVDEYMVSPVRKPICAGNTYASEPLALRIEMDAIMNSVPGEEIRPGAKGLLLPHIDFQIGPEAHETYAAGYHAIKNTNADLFVIFGTSHRVSADYFMYTRKNYSTPFGEIQTDTEILDYLNENMSFEPTVHEMAHFGEHSIEIQLVLLQRLFENRHIKILPVLTGSFHPFIEFGGSPESDERFNEYVDKLNEAIAKLGRNPVFIASVDFGHTGRRFEHDFDAEDKFDELTEADMKLIASLKNADSEGFFRNIADVKNFWNVCGVSPIYTLLKTLKPKEGVFLKHNIWNDAPTQSAVSFASMAYYD